MKDIKKITRTEYIKYVFSEEEMAEMAGKMAQAFSEKEAAEQRLKEIQKQIKAEIEACQTQISTLSRHYNTGHAYRNCECVVEYHFSEKQVRIYRADTGELVSSRVMKADEFQADMFDDYIITAPEEIPEEAEV
jgi:hypothetical protein